jgi:nucleoside-diphosphate-sugar epimerase
MRGIQSSGPRRAAAEVADVMFGSAAALAEYEAAAERFNRASENAPRIREICRQLAEAAEAEYEAAAADLARYEVPGKPGVPLPQYRSRYLTGH